MVGFPLASMFLSNQKGYPQDAQLEERRPSWGLSDGLAEVLLPHRQRLLSADHRAGEGQLEAHGAEPERRESAGIGGNPRGGGGVADMFPVLGPPKVADSLEPISELINSTFLSCGSGPLALF